MRRSRIATISFKSFGTQCARSTTVPTTVSTAPNANRIRQFLNAPLLRRTAIKPAIYTKGAGRRTTLRSPKPTSPYATFSLSTATIAPKLSASSGLRPLDNATRPDATITLPGCWRACSISARRQSIPLRPSPTRKPSLTPKSRRMRRACRRSICQPTTHCPQWTLATSTVAT